jgi:hypothetical protein
MARLSTWLTIARKWRPDHQIPTMTEVIQVSWRLVQWILRAAARDFAEETAGVLAKRLEEAGLAALARRPTRGHDRRGPGGATRIACGRLPRFPGHSGASNSHLERRTIRAP